MSFNPYISKQSQEVIFSGKVVNDVPVARCSTHKHLGIYFDKKLNFAHHKTEKFAKSQQR